MLNYIWIGFFLIAFVVALVKLIFFQDTAVFPAMMEATFEMAKTGFTLSIGLTGVMTLWLGLMKIGERGGMITIISRLFGPFFARLFPEVPKDHPANGAITSTKVLTINSKDKQTLIWLVFIQVLFVTMVYGPIAAFLVEMFPTKIRYTSMSLPYHIGNGVFGGLLPAVATYLATNAKTAGKSDWYLEGLWYPIGVAAVCLVIGVIYINGKDKEIND